MWIFQHFMKGTDKKALEHRKFATNVDDPQTGEALTTYYQVVNNLLAIYATDEVIAKVQAEVTKFKQLEGICAVRHSKVLGKKDYPFIFYFISQI